MDLAEATDLIRWKLHFVGGVVVSAGPGQTARIDVLDQGTPDMEIIALNVSEEGFVASLKSFRARVFAARGVGAGINANGPARGR